MSTKEELQQRPPITANDMMYREGQQGVYVLIDGLITELAHAELRNSQGFFEALGRKIGAITSQPAWEGWSGWSAGYKLRCAVLLKAGWTYHESLSPYQDSANAYEKVRKALISPACRSATDLWDLI